ncbi:MAG: response regulator [Lachnospiraceae bacterium]
MKTNKITTEQAMREQLFAGKRVLLAEDNEINREIAKTLLRLLGIKVECVSNGKEALLQYFASPPGYYDIILLDIMMPIMDGVQTALEIRKKEKVKTVIIAYTTRISTENLEEYQEAGIDDYLKKPTDIIELCQVLSKWI